MTKQEHYIILRLEGVSHPEALHISGMADSCSHVRNTLNKAKVMMRVPIQGMEQAIDRYKLKREEARATAREMGLMIRATECALAVKKRSLERERRQNPQQGVVCE